MALNLIDRQNDVSPPEWAESEFEGLDKGADY